MTGVNFREVEAADDDLRLDRWFRRHYAGLSHGRLEKLLRTGQVRVDGKRAKSGFRLKEGQMVRVPPLGDQDKKSRRQTSPMAESDRAFVRGLVVREDDLFFALNKPAGLAVQGGSKTPRHIDGMLGGLVEEGSERPRLVHRLDKDTSGVLLVARSAQAADRLGKCFRHRLAKKQYWALVAGVPTPRQGEIDLPLAKMGTQGRERVQPDPESGQSALTRYYVVETIGRRCAWVALYPLTGRTHQLRVHMAAIGHPILGDGKYGGERAFLDGVTGKMHLHANQIAMPHPAGRGELLVNAPLTSHMLESWRFFGLDDSLDLEIEPGEI